LSATGSAAIAPTIQENRFTAPESSYRPYTQGTAEPSAAPGRTASGAGSSRPARQDKFKEAAREHEVDEDEKRWEERLKRVAKDVPVPPRPGPLREKPRK
jgi:hypothetical protein